MVDKIIDKIESDRFNYMVGQLGILAGLTKLFQHRVQKLGAVNIQTIDRQSLISEDNYMR